MKLGLVVHPDRPRAREVAERLVAGASDRGIQVLAGPRDAERIGAVEGDLSSGVEVLVAIGGDGTVLRAAALALEADVPVLGVNVGRVGYMSEVEPDALEAALDDLVDGRWTESTRMTVSISLPGGSREAGLNDVVLEKLHGPRAVGLSVEVDGEPFVTYHADGLMVATPTGSTAYNYSAGGPLLDPELEALVLTPVAPHGLFGRSVVFGPGTLLRVTVSEERPVGVNVDGRQVGRLEAGSTVEIRRGSDPVRFVRLSRDGFAAVLRVKLGLDRA